MVEKAQLRGFGGFIDRWITRYGFWVAVGGTGLVSAKFAAASAWLDKWGPIGWWSAFLLGCVLAAMVFAIITWARGRWLRDRELRKVLSDTGVNPLSNRFERQIIRLIDFYHPYYIAHENKDFRDCELTGPGLVYFENVNANGTTFRHVQIVIVRTDPDLPIFGVTHFKSPKFVGGAFTNFTMLVNRATYDSLPDAMKAHIPVISE